MLGSDMLEIGIGLILSSFLFYELTNPSGKYVTL